MLLLKRHYTFVKTRVKAGNMSEGKLHRISTHHLLRKTTGRYVYRVCYLGMSCPSWQRHRTGSRWSPVRTLPVAPLWCDLGFVPNSRGNKAAANLRPISICDRNSAQCKDWDVFSQWAIQILQFHCRYVTWVKITYSFLKILSRRLKV